MTKTTYSLVIKHNNFNVLITVNAENYEQAMKFAKERVENTPDSDFIPLFNNVKAIN
jgi:hypothetical protein